MNKLYKKITILIACCFMLGYSAAFSTNSNTKSDLVINDKTVTVKRVSDLSKIHRRYGKDVETAIVLGYHEPHDGGGGIFVYEKQREDENDNGLVFNGWVRTLIGGSINVKWFGAQTTSSKDDLDNKKLRDRNTKAFQQSVLALKNGLLYRPDLKELLSTPQATKGIFIPSGEYIIGEKALFTPDFGRALSKITFFSDGNAILSCMNPSDTFVFHNRNHGQFLTFRNITFIGYNPEAHLFLSESFGVAQDYYFDRCSFEGAFGTIFKVRGDPNGNTNSEWGFSKCAFTCFTDAVLDVEDSDQFLNYWFDQTKFWLKGNSKTLVANSGGHFKFINCDWSGFKPDQETYIFELMGAQHEGVMDFRIVNGRFEMKSQEARVLKTNWKTGNIEISADFGSQLFSQGYGMKHFDFQIQNNSSLNIAFKNSVMMGYHEYHYKNGSFRGTSRATYDNCAFPRRCELDGFIKVDSSGVNKSGIAMISIEDAILHDIDVYNLQVTDVDFFPMQSNRGLKKKYYKMANPATGRNPIDGIELQLNFPEEAESVITAIKWNLPEGEINTEGRFWLSDLEGNLISEIGGNLVEGFSKEEKMYLKIADIPEGKLILRSNKVYQISDNFVCIIEYY